MYRQSGSARDVTESSSVREWRLNILRLIAMRYARCCDQASVVLCCTTADINWFTTETTCISISGKCCQCLAILVDVIRWDKLAQITADVVSPTCIALWHHLTPHYKFKQETENKSERKYYTKDNKIRFRLWKIWARYQHRSSTHHVMYVSRNDFRRARILK